MVQLHTVARGDPEKPAVVFVHALGTDHRFWDEVIARLEGEYFCVAPDLQAAGGGTPTPSRPVAAEAHADDLLELARSLRLRRAAFVGCAIGGMVSAICAARDPDLVAGLVMTNPGVGNADAVKGMLRARVDEVRRHGMGTLLPAAAERSFHGMPKAARYELYVERYAAQDPEAYATSVLGFLDIDVRPVLPDVTCPVLLVPGGLDVLMPADGAEVVASLVTQAETIRFEDVAHFVPFQAPDRFVAVLRPFLATRVDWQARP